LEPLNTSSSPTIGRGSCTSVVLLILAWIYTVAISFGRIGITLVASAFEAQLPETTPFVLAVGQAILLLIPLGLLALLWREPRYAGIYRSWVMAAGLVLLLSPIHLTRPYLAQQHALLHILLAWLYIFILLFLTRRRRSNEEPTVERDMQRPTAIVGAFLAGGLFAYPWLVQGALGSLLDTLLQASAALSLGLATAVIVETSFVYTFKTPLPFSDKYFGRPGELILSGFGASMVLLIVASSTAFGYGGMQLALMLCLPSLGWLMVWLSRSHALSNRGGFSEKRLLNRSLPGGVLVGLAASAPMALVDPSELHFLVSAYTGEIFQLALSTAGTSALIGLFLSVLSVLVFARESRQDVEISGRRVARLPGIPFALAGVVWAIGALIYFVFGQPGFYGESLFVILKEQAPLPSYTPGDDYFQHRAQVYEILVGHAQQSQAGLRSDLDRFHLSYTPYYLVNAIEVRGGPLVRSWLASRPEVDRVLLNPWMRPLPELPQASPGILPAPQETPWNLTLVHADQVWDELGVTGEGIVVGQSDSGVQADHPELAANYRGRDDTTGRHDYNWFDPWYNTETPQDLNGHGTHTLGTVAGQNTGIAPGATWYSCANLVRVFGNPALYLDCMQFMMAPFPINADPFIEGEPSLGAHVTNNSWGCPELEGCDPGALLPAVQALRSAGVFMAVSAGNDGPSCETINAPLALYEEVTTVGAINQSGQLVDFSSRGPVTADGSGLIKPDILAPGLDVLSAFPGDSYSALPGTSMAGPHVTGTVALIWSANPALIGDIDRTEQILALSAQPYTGSVPACPGADQLPSTAYGYGILDAYSAVLLALDLPSP
jgi:hypothetical protein